MSDSGIQGIHGEWEPGPILKRMLAYEYAYMLKALHHMWHVARQLGMEGGIYETNCQNQAQPSAHQAH